MKECFERMFLRLRWIFKIYLPYKINVFFNLISTRDRWVHGAMIYECRDCHKKWRMYLEVGVEGKTREVNKMPCPYTISCRCGGIAEHIDFHKDFFLPHPMPLGEYACFFMLDRIGMKKEKRNIHGLPILRKKGWKNGL